MYRKSTYENLFEKFLVGVEKTKNVDYLDRNSIRENNMGVDQYRKAAKKISELYPERVEDFASLLDSNDTKERICCAVCVLEFMSFSKEIYEKAYSCNLF